MATFFNDLPELTDIIDFIEPENEMNENTDQIVESCYELIDQYLIDNPTAISDPDFEEILLEDLTELLLIQMDDLTNQEEDDLTDMIEYAMETYFEIVPPRSYQDTIILHKPEIKGLQKQLDYLKSKPQPVQRTPDWYTFRHNLITASNAYKAFENQNVQNQLIYEKCQPLIKNTTTELVVNQVNINTTLHWGQKYEPLSVMIYEYMYKTTVDDFGCIQHDTYSFLGASPDGINVDTQSDRFGRMLEIKNIVNREIDGIPKKEYWIQMQLQMETCNLDECDFLETKFVEYEDVEKYMEDGDFSRTPQNQQKGVIMYFANTEGNPVYKYMPLNIKTIDEYTRWEQDLIDNLGLTWISNYYWKLDIISCVLVPRNKQWFQTNVQELQNIWNIILKERDGDYSHRAPMKRQVKPKENNEHVLTMTVEQEECLIKL